MPFQLRSVRLSGSITENNLPAGSFFTKVVSSFADIDKVAQVIQVHDDIYVPAVLTVRHP